MAAKEEEVVVVEAAVEEEEVVVVEVEVAIMEGEGVRNSGAKEDKARWTGREDLCITTSSLSGSASIIDSEAW